MQNYTEIFFHYPVIRDVIQPPIPIGTLVALARNQLFARCSRNSIECTPLIKEYGTALAGGDNWLALVVKCIDESEVSQAKIDFFCKISLIPS
jgi:hypothetical protein